MRIYEGGVGVSLATCAVVSLALLALLGLGWSMYVAAIQPEGGMDWDNRTGEVIDVAPGGSPAEAGLREGDVVLTLDSVPRMLAPTVTNGKRAGETLWLVVSRGAEIHVLSFTLQRPPASVLFDRMLPLVVGVGFVVIALAAFLFSQRQLPDRLFVLECLIVAAILGAGTLSTFKLAVASRLFHTFLVLVCVPGIDLHLRFPQERVGPNIRRVLVAGYVISGLLALLFVLPAWNVWRWEPWYSTLQRALRLLLGMSLLVDIGALIAAGQSSNRRARRHARLLVVGVMLGLAPFLLLALLPDLLTDHPFLAYQYTFPFLLTLPLAYGYTLARARLSHLDRSVARLVAALAIGVVLFSAYGLAVRCLERVRPVWLPAMLAAAGGLVFWPLTREAERFTDRVLFDIRYNYTTVVSALNEQLARTLDRPTLRELLVDRLPQLMPFDGAALLLAREEGDLYLEPPARLEVEVEHPLPGQGALLRDLLQRKGPVSAAKLRADLAGVSLTAAEREWLNNLAIETWLPLTREGRMPGVLLLGPRSGGDLLDGEDRRILHDVARQAALAAENVMLADALRDSRAGLARAHGELLLAREDERRRLAWSLHDGPIQDLTAISNRLATLSAQADSREMELAELRSAVIEQIRTLRRLYMRLRPGTLDELGLRGALRALAIECEDTHAIPVTFSARGDVDDLPDVVEVTLFRLAQEALINAARHSEATRLWVDITCADGRAMLTVTDNGRGFRVPKRLSALAQAGHFGLTGMAERVELLGGSLDVRSQPDTGTTVQAWLPVETREEGRS